MAQIHITIALADSVDSTRVASELRALGMIIENSDGELGFVAGSCDEAALERLRAVSGVVAVEPARRYQLPDPSSPQ